jgi:hypothetical protein
VYEDSDGGRVTGAGDGPNGVDPNAAATTLTVVNGVDVEALGDAVEDSPPVVPFAD